MQLQKESFVVRVAYWDRKPPARTNVCALFWSFVFSVFTLAPFYIFVGGLAVGGHVLFNICTGLFGYRVAAPWERDEIAIRPYRRWPQWRGKNLQPFWFLLGLLALLYGPPFVRWLAAGSEGARLTLGLFTFTVLIVAASAFVVGAERLHIGRALREVRAIVGAFWKAKKERVCPIVTILGVPPPPQAE